MGDLWVLWVKLIIICLGSICLAQRTSNDKTQATQLRLMTKAGEGEPLPRRGTSIRENDIAAIFRGVAYGAPTQGKPNTTISSFTLQPGIASSPSSLISTVTSAKHLIDNTHSNFAPMINPSGHPQNPGSEIKANQTSIVHKDKNTIQKLNGDVNNNSEFQNGNVISEITSVSPNANNANNYDITSTAQSDFKGKNEVSIDGDHSFIDQRLNLGLVWWIQVYISLGLFTVLAIVSLCFMLRFASATHLLSRPHYLILHILIFLTASLRSFHTLHDAHSINGMLSVPFLTTIDESIWPCLIAALAVILMAVLREWHYPRHPYIALALALITIVHLITLPSALLAAMLLKEDENIPIKITTRVVTATWGSTVGMGGMWAVWQESRDYSSQLTDIQLRNNQGSHLNLIYPARLVFTAALTQLLLACLHVYTLLMPVSPDNHIWMWWLCISIARSFELIVGSTLVSAAALTLDSSSQCCVFRPCCQKRTVEIVHPTEIKMIHPMGVYTLQPSRPKNEHAQTIAALSLSNPHKEKRNHSSLDYVTSDFQLVWNHNRQRPLTASHTTQRLIEDTMPRAHILPVAPRNALEHFPKTNAFSSTLPRNRMYASPPSCLQLEDEDVKGSKDRGINCTSKSSTLLSESSGSSKLYSSPQIPLRTSRSWDELSTGHVYEDPLKTKPGSVDEGLSDISDLNSDNVNDIFVNETCSPVLFRPKKRSRRRHNTACYLSAHQFTTHQPASKSEKRSDQKTTEHEISKSSSTEKSPSELGEFHPTILPPPPFQSDAQNTSTVECGALHPPSAQTSSLQHNLRKSLSRCKAISMPDHHEGY